MARDFYPTRLLAGVAVAAAVFWITAALPWPDNSSSYGAQMAAAITALVATYWLSGAMPIGPASLLPLALMPLTGVLSLKDAAASYAHPIIWLFFGGFVLALGVERWGLHRRIALQIIARMGFNPARLILGFMIAAAFLSMWMTNTATTLLLLPIAQALIRTTTEEKVFSGIQRDNFAFALLLGIAYAASIGGLGTPIGTTPNALFLSTYRPLEEQGAPPISFLTWMAIGCVTICLMLPTVWLLLTRWLAPVSNEIPRDRSDLLAEATRLPPMDRAEKSILALFALAAVLWVTRQDVNLGQWDLNGWPRWLVGDSPNRIELLIPGWWRLLPIPKASYIGDGVVAVAVAILAFFVPSGKKPGQALIDWPTAKKLPWDILLLFGGGIAIAHAFTATGLAGCVAMSIRPLVGQVPAILLVMATCFLVTFLTEVTSNTAMTALLLPILVSVSLAAKIDPRLLMLPATFSASFAFMLPVATPPNAIVFSSGQISMRRMARTGLWVNVLGVVLITLVVWFVVIPLLDISTTDLPPWAEMP